jgi:hypothetical protein
MQIKNTRLDYIEWEATEVASFILRKTEERVEKAKSLNMKELQLRYDMEVIEDGLFRKLYDYEKEYYRVLLRSNGYSLPSEYDLEDGMSSFKDKLGNITLEAPFFEWITEDERLHKQKSIKILIIIMVIAIIGIALGQAWIYGLI